MKYTAPEMNVVKFEAEEVIVASADVSTEQTYEFPDSDEW